MMDNESSRTSKACNSCKERKRKCDRAEPRCSFCVQRNTVCEYRTLHKPGLPPGYGTNMMQKLASIEEGIQEGQVSASNDMLRVLGQLEVLDSRLKSIEQQLSVNFKSAGPYEAQIDGSYLTGPHASVGGPLDTSVEQGELELQVSAPEGQTPFAHTVEHITLSWPLPTMETVVKLVDRFFAYVYPAFRVIHPHFRERLLSSYSNFLVSATESSEAPPQILGVLVCALCFAHDLLSPSSIASCRDFCKSTIIAKCLAISTMEQLQAMALLAYDLYGRSNNPETWGYISLISNALIHLNLTNAAASTIPIKYNSLQHKRQKIVTIHNVRFLKTSLDPFEEECRRNLVWEIFILDRLSSVSNSFPCKISEANIECLLPLKGAMWKPGMQDRLERKLQDRRPPHESNSDSACFLVEITHILGDVHSFLRLPLDYLDVKNVLAWQMHISELDSELQTWTSTLPDEYKLFLDCEESEILKALSIKDVLFFSIYHMTIIRLNSAVGYLQFHDSCFFMFSNAAQTKCLSSAEKMVSFSKTLPEKFGQQQQSVYSICGPFYSFTIWVAARLLFVNATKYEKDIPADLDTLTAILEDSGNTWESSFKYADILSFLRDEELQSRRNGNSMLDMRVVTFDMLDSKGHRNGARDGGEDSVNPENGEVDLEVRAEGVKAHSKNAQIFADMRLNAYSLDVLLSDKIEAFKKKKNRTASPSNHADFSSFFEWFKIPLAELGTVHIT